MLSPTKILAKLEQDEALGVAWYVRSPRPIFKTSGSCEFRGISKSMCFSNCYGLKEMSCTVIFLCRLLNVLKIMALSWF